ncbi:MAG: hypothetical protein R3B96_07110 [Pirellulaceae bacterium]
MVHLSGRIADGAANNLMIEISGRESKIEAFIERMRPYGIVEPVRTGDRDGPRRLDP